MITLHILQLLSDNGFGTIKTDLHWEELPAGKIGIAIISRGAPRAYRQKIIQSFDLYSRGTDDLLGAHNLESITTFLDSQPYECQLPFVPNVSEKKYQKVHFEPESAIENLGRDENDRMIWRSTYQAYYTKG